MGSMLHGWGSDLIWNLDEVALHLIQGLGWAALVISLILLIWNEYELYKLGMESEDNEEKRSS